MLLLFFFLSYGNGIKVNNATVAAIQTTHPFLFLPFPFSSVVLLKRLPFPPSDHPLETHTIQDKLPFSIFGPVTFPHMLSR